MSQKEQIKQGAVRMDMLHGSLLNKILLFALPLAASSILQQLFNSVDIAVVGKFASSQALLPAVRLWLPSGATVRSSV